MDPDYHNIPVYLFVIGVLLWYVYTQYFQSSLVYVKSTVDNKSYLVRALPDKQQAADLLATIGKKLSQVKELFTKHYPNDKRVILLNKRFRADEVSESEPNSKYTSYTINKGEKIIYCLRSRDEKQQLVDANVLLFVALHEMSHVMTVSIDHSPEFWDNFRFVLANAIHWGIYKNQDFKGNPKEYCGTQITNSPLELKDMPKYVKYNQSVDDTNEAFIVNIS
jgi:hypothetical protein